MLIRFFDVASAQCVWSRCESTHTRTHARVFVMTVNQRHHRCVSAAVCLSVLYSLHKSLQYSGAVVQRVQ